MTYRMTVVLEYPDEAAAPRIGAKSVGRDLGDGQVCAVQFSDALAELEVYCEHAPHEIGRAADIAATAYKTKQPHNSGEGR